MLTAQTLLLTALTVSQPSPDHVKSVFEHYYQGEGAIVLADAYLCSDIEKKKKDTKYDCLLQAGAEGAKGDQVYVYMTFLVPKGMEKDLMVQAIHNGVVRQTRDFKVKGSFIRARSWRRFSLKKSGTWEFKILDGATELKTLRISAE